MPGGKRWRPAPYRACRDTSVRPEAGRSARRSAAARAATAIPATAPGGCDFFRRPSLGQGDDSLAARRQHVVDAWLEPTLAIQSAGLKKGAGAGVRLVDQAVHLTAVRSGRAKLDVGNQQADLRLLGKALILFQHSLTKHDLDALRQDAGQGMVRRPARIRGAVVNGHDMRRAELDRLGQPNVLRDRPIDELFVADPIGVEQSWDR